jgi:crotonobetainyl-CoA:carnitine CoA-transferase CaiB-like acyl-CoA transferase
MTASAPPFASTARGGALAGVIVADFSRVLAGPYLTMLLGDLGATVIKVEGPDGDGTRRWGPPWHQGESTYFHSINRNKASICLDLKVAADRQLAREMARRSDVLVENLLPGAMARYGLDYEETRKANPCLIYCSISGYGPQADGARLPGYDMLAQAASGLMSITGPPEGPSYRTGVALVDLLCGLHAAVGILAALSLRKETGQGQHVEVNLLLTGLSALANQASAFLLAGVEPKAMGNAHPSVAPYDTFPTMDGEIVIAVGNDHQFEQLCVALGLDDAKTDPRFLRNPDRVLNRHDLTVILVKALERLTRDEAVKTLQSRGVPSGPVNNVRQAFDYAASVGLDATWSLDGNQYVRTPIMLSQTPPEARSGPPALDSSGDAIREWLLS